ncbi:MAG: hypothetical protein ACE366_10230 [Bradymonadia bacterium]
MKVQPHHILMLALCMLLSAASQAWAHKKKPVRTVLMTMRPAKAKQGALSADALLSLRLPPGPQTGWLKAQHDLDRDGRLSTAEGEALGAVMAKRVLGSWQLSVGGSLRKPTARRVHGRIDQDGGVTAVVLLVYEVEEPLKAAVVVEGRFAGGVKGEQGARIEMGAISPLVFVDASGQSRPRWVPSTLKPGGSGYSASVRLMAQGSSLPAP